MPANRIFELIARKLSGEATTAELQELNDYLQQHAGDQYVYDILDKYWSQHPRLVREEANDEEERFRHILQAADEAAHMQAEPAVIPAEPRVRKMPWKIWIRYAAAAAVVVTATIVFFYWDHNKKIATTSFAEKQEPLKEVSVRPGSRSKLVLPDGTQVWLNADSRISYLHTFNNTLREVHLEGEAYFDVTHHASRPFIVHTSGIAIKVLGTAFTVKSYESDNTIEATLLRGSIEVVKNNDPSAPKVILRPHEKLVYNREEQAILTPSSGSDTVTTPVSSPVRGILVTTLPKNTPDSALKETSWVYNKLMFDGDRFDELITKLERWYDVHITIKDESLKHYRLRGAFENETIRQALEALQLTVPFQYRMHENNIEILKK